MSISVALMMVGLFALPWTMAGVICPTAVGLRYQPTWRIALIGVSTCVFFLVLAKLLPSSVGTASEPISKTEDAIATIWVLAGLLWPLFAVLLRTFLKYRERRRDRLATSPEASGFSPPTYPPRDIERKKSTPKKPRARPSEASMQPSVAPRSATAKSSSRDRTSRNSWNLGVVEFMYKDADGDISQRMVTVHSVTDIYLKGECHQRLAERTFRLNRIISQVTDCDTGEMLSPECWAKGKRRLLKNR